MAVIDGIGFDEAEELANHVQDVLRDHAIAYPGTSPEALAREAYGVVMAALGHSEEEEE